MREIKDHIVEDDLPQNQLKIEVMDEPGAGGASHVYAISCKDAAEYPADTDQFDLEGKVSILFQNGPINEAGLNGLTQEVLLAIVIDRLRSFQTGPFPCFENQEALEACTYALEMLKKRTRERLARGVEGKTLP